MNRLSQCPPNAGNVGGSKLLDSHGRKTRSDTGQESLIGAAVQRILLAVNFLSLGGFAYPKRRGIPTHSFHHAVNIPPHSSFPHTQASHHPNTLISPDCQPIPLSVLHTSSRRTTSTHSAHQIVNPSPSAFLIHPAVTPPQHTHFTRTSTIPPRLISHIQSLLISQPDTQPPLPECQPIPLSVLHTSSRHTTSTQPSSPGFQQFALSVLHTSRRSQQPSPAQRPPFIRISTIRPSECITHPAVPPPQPHSFPPAFQQFPPQRASPIQAAHTTPHSFNHHFQHPRRCRIYTIPITFSTSQISPTT